MIPVRVMVRGFLSYRDEAEVTFNDAKLWMLWGRNGAGKSAVFDAITFALYGSGRFGDGAVKEYIHHDAPNMHVEFDFDLDGQRFRVKRTASRTTNSTYQAFTLDPNDAGAAPVPVAGAKTHTEKGLEDWVKRALNMDCGTFVASALLRQGSSDRLLSASGAERAGMMSRIVDLNAYEKLHKVTEAQSSLLKNEADGCRTRMTQRKGQITTAAAEVIARFALDPAAYALQENWRVDAARLIERLAEIETQAAGDVGRLQALLDVLNRIGATLPAWKRGLEEYTGLHEARAAHAAILAHAGEIERRAARFQEMTATIPAHRDWITARANWRSANEACDNAAAAIAQWGAQLAALNLRLPCDSDALAQARTKQEAAVKVLAEAEAEVKTLQVRHKDLLKAEGRAECQVCGKTLTEAQRLEQMAGVAARLVAAKAAEETAQTAKKDAEQSVRLAEKQVTQTKDAIARAEHSVTTEKSGLRLAERDRLNAVANAERVLATLAATSADCAGLTVNDAPYVPEDIGARMLGEGDTAGALRTGTYPTAADMRMADEEKQKLQGADAEKTNLEAARAKSAGMDAQIAVYAGQFAQSASQIEVEAAALDMETARAMADALTSAAKTVTEECDKFAGIAALSEPAQQQAQREATKERIALALTIPGGLAQTQVTAARQAMQAAQSSRDHAHDAHTALQKDCSDYDTVAAQERNIRRQYKAYHALADKLGRTGLQSWLRVAAEQSIVTYANHTLQRLSNGMLTMQLADNGRGQSLDLNLTDHEKGGEGARNLKPQALSGSQKFRVSVALALGIGQYACGQSRGGVKSVIIDEGFGSLDKEGREQMIAELQNLGKVLERIIVVSHQEEFETAFPNRWHIFVKDGTAQTEPLF